jgi:ATP-binding cassette subfamily C protein
MKDIVQQLYGVLTPRERRNLLLLFAIVLIMAGLEVVSVASIMPLLSVASDPKTIYGNPFLKWTFETFGFTDTQSFLIALGVGALLALVLSNAFIIFVTWLQNRYVWNRNHSISRRLLQSYLQQPYDYYLTKNSSNLSKNILEEAREVSVKMLRPALNGTARAIVALAIIVFLVYIDPVVAIVVAVILGGSYEGIYLLVRNKLDNIGERRVVANRTRYQSVSEVFGGIKEVKLRGKEDVFLDKFDQPSRLYARYQALNDVIATAPRYILDTVAFGSIILILVYLITVEGDIQQVVPMLGLYAFAGYRLMPALQKAFQGMAKARFNKAALDTLHRDLHQLRSAASLDEEDSSRAVKEQLRLRDRIVVDRVTFAYPEADEPAIQSFSLEIPAKSIVGFVGKTGSGKTTAVDLLLGLLRPDEGEIRIDGLSLNEENNLHGWRRNVGYVPQNIYLSDDSIAQNIAFGIPRDELDHEAVREAVRSAQLEEYVEKLPDGLETLVGERGVKLSGGQRQRIGIARALYHGPSVIFFDEATSALDRETEQAVMDAVYALGETRTVIMISHRLSTVRQADLIFMLEDGRLIGEGTFRDLSQKNSAFRKMASAGSG